MKEILFGGMLTVVIILAGIGIAHENVAGLRFHQNVCSESNAVACIEQGKNIPND